MSSSLSVNVSLKGVGARRMYSMDDFYPSPPHPTPQQPLSRGWRFSPDLSRLSKLSSVRPKRLTARGLVQHGSSPGWLKEIDLLDGPCRLP